MSLPDRVMRAAVLGAVGSTAVAVRTVAASPLELVGVAGQEPKAPSRVSGLSDLRKLALEVGTDYLGFRKANDPAVVERLRTWDLDYLFVIGLSQLVSREVIATARCGCIGYHPTALPLGRGRAPVAWLVLGKAPAASTLFEIQAGADAGGILEQVPFTVGPRMDAADVSRECHRTLKEGLGRLLPRLASGEWQPVAQDDQQATYLGKRSPADGLIDWLRSADEVDALIRAAAPPHPGAYCYSDGRRLRILGSDGVVAGSPFTGVPGRVLRRLGQEYDVQCEPGVLRVRSIVGDNDLPVELREGTLLRTPVEDELHSLRRRVEDLERVLAELRGMLS